MFIKTITVLIGVFLSSIVFAQAKNLENKSFSSTQTSATTSSILGTKLAAWGNYNSNQRYRRSYRGRYYRNYNNTRYKKRYRRYYRRSSWFFGRRYSVPKVGPANSKGTFVFDPRRLTWAAYDPSGKLVRSGHAVGGANYCPDVRRACRTPVGRFRVYHKGPAECRSRKYPIGIGGAYMPHCVFFRGGYAIHGATNVPNYNASHGCIRVYPREASWLYYNFMRPGTVVIVKPY